MAVPEATLVCATCGGALKADGDAPDAAGFRSFTCVSCGTPVRHAAPKQISTLTAVVVGAGAMVFGAALVLFTGYLPYREVMNAAPSVRFSLTGLLAGPLFVGLGFLAMIARFLPGPTPGKKRPVVGAVVLAILFLPPIAGLVAFFWLTALARARGYDL